MKKILIITVLSLCTIFTIYAQTADTYLQKLLNKKDFFKLQKEYPVVQKNASEFMQIYTQAFLQNAFNQPSKSNEYIQQVFSKYYSSLDFEKYMRITDLMAQNFSKLENYKNAEAIYSQLIENTKSSLDKETLNSLENFRRYYSTLEDIQPLVVEVNYNKGEYKLPVKKDSKGMLTLPISANNHMYNCVMDYGSSMSMLPEAYAKSLGIKILFDSVRTVGGSFTTYSKIGIADEIAIGNIVCKNVLFTIQPDSLIKGVPNYEIEGIIGLPVIQRFGTIIFKPNGNITISKPVSKTRELHNFMLKNDLLYVQAIDSNDTLCMLFDSGSNESRLYDNYFKRNPAIIQNIQKDTSRLAGVGGYKTYTSYNLKDFTCTIDNEKLKFNSLQLVLGAGMDIQDDGTIGLDIFNLNKEISIDLTNMYFSVR